MLTSERKSLILARLAAEGRVVATDLARELAVSEDTIRRDLRDMAADGLLDRVHGGALPLSPPLPDLNRRLSIDLDEKRALARRAASLIEPGMTVFIDGGSTHRQLVDCLPRDLPFVAVTHAPTIAAALEPFERVEINLIGGRIYRHSMVAVGATALQAISMIAPDLAFLGVTGITAGQGLTTGDIEEAAIKRGIAERARRVVVLATRAKLGVASPATILPLSAARDIVAAGPVSAEHRSMLAQAGVDLLEA